MSSDAFSDVGLRRKPGPFNWGCQSCGGRDPYKANKHPGCWNGAQSMSCRGCQKAPSSKCVRFGTNGKDGGKWKKWDPDNPPKARPKSSTPTPRIPGVQTPDQKRMEKQLADAKKKQSEQAQLIKQLQAKQPAAAPAAAAAATAAANGTAPTLLDPSIASETNQAAKVRE